MIPLESSSNISINRIRQNVISKGMLYIFLGKTSMYFIFEIHANDQILKILIYHQWMVLLNLVKEQLHEI